MKEPIEFKIIRTITKLEENNFDMTKYTKELKEQETLEDYEELYNELIPYLECFKAITMLKSIERKLTETEKIQIEEETKRFPKEKVKYTLEDIVEEMLNAIEIIRKNRATFEENKEHEQIEKQFYSLIYKLITLEIIENLDSKILDTVLEEEKDAIKISEHVYDKEIPYIEAHKTEYQEEYVKALELKIEEDNKKGNLNLLDKEIILIINNIQYNKEILASIKEKQKEIESNQELPSVEMRKADRKVGNYLGEQKDMKAILSKTNKQIKRRVFALIASVGILASISTFAMKKSEGLYTDYETTQTIITKDGEEVTVNESKDKFNMRKLDDDEKITMQVHYDSFETSTGYKHYMEEFILPEGETKEIKEYLAAPTSKLTLQSSQLLNQAGQSGRKIIIREQNLDEPITKIDIKLCLSLLILLVNLLISQAPYMPLDSLFAIIRLIKRKKEDKEQFTPIIDQIESYIKDITESLTVSEENLKKYNRIKEVAKVLEIDFKENPEFETLEKTIEETNNKIRKLEMNN